MSLPAVPKTSPILLDAYNTLNPLILPPPSTFPYPLIESFAVAHDPLTEEYGHKIFTTSMALREAGVQIDRASRDIARLDGKKRNKDTTASGEVTESEAEPEAGIEAPFLSLSEVKKSRLRAKLQSQSKLPSSSGPSTSTPTSKEAVLRAAKERKVKFDAEIAREEEEALEEFKKGLREAVLLAPGI